MSGTTHKGTALKGAVMQVVQDSGWLGFETSHRADSFDALMLSRLSGGLRKLYQDLLNEPLPEHLVAFVREIEERGRFANEGLTCDFFVEPIPDQDRAGARVTRQLQLDAERTEATARVEQARQG